MLLLNKKYLDTLKRFSDLLERYPDFPRYMIWDPKTQIAHIRVNGVLKRL